MSKKTRFLLLMLLSMISVFFAEVISGSMKYPLLDLWGYFIVIPLYGLHTIILLYIIVRTNENKRILFSTLYFAGVLFGLYEAYLTKVLWVGLSPEKFMFLELSIIDFIVLVFFWHPIFSFIIPSLVFEKLMTNTDYIYQGLPKLVRSILETKIGIVILFIVIGAFSAFNGLSMDGLFLSLITMSGPIILIIYLFRRKDIHLKYSLSEILPSKRGIIFCSVYLTLIYLFLTFTVSFEVLTLSNQIVIWVNYLIFGFIFYRKVMNNTKEASSLPNSIPISFLTIITYLYILIISGSLFVLVFWLLGIKDVFAIVTWISWIVIGMYLLIYSAFR